MKELLMKNFEKVILTTLLVVLAGSSVFLILTMDRTEIKVINNPNAGAMVQEGKIDDIPTISVKLADEKVQPYDPRGYIYCRKSDCDYLILSSLPKCPWCKTDTKPEVIVAVGKGDKDSDGIPDQDEIKLGLNPEDPKDIYLDADEDGFMNIDEYKADTDLSDPGSHPSVITRSKLHPRIRLTTYYPIIFSYFSITDEKDKKTWDIYGDIIVNRRKKSIFKRVNDKISEIGYTITDVGKEDGKEFIVIEKDGEEPVKIYAGKKQTPMKTVYVIENELTSERAMIELGKEFKLK
ncbi:MAG: hypothetical protein NE327_03790, partial [Lentisphaeraceae bacterium]|nr:hypothetical protein [Lentisphaeraceae bacterium]